MVDIALRTLSRLGKQNWGGCIYLSIAKGIDPQFAQSEGGGGMAIGSQLWDIGRLFRCQEGRAGFDKLRAWRQEHGRTRTFTVSLTFCIGWGWKRPAHWLLQCGAKILFPSPVNWTHLLQWGKHNFSPHFQAIWKEPFSTAVYRVKSQLPYEHSIISEA